MNGNGVDPQGVRNLIYSGTCPCGELVILNTGVMVIDMDKIPSQTLVFCDKDCLFEWLEDSK